MSNADTIRTFYEVASRRDFLEFIAAGDIRPFFEQSEHAPLLDYIDPELVIREPAELPDAGVFEGPEAYPDAMAQWPTTFDDWRVDLVELIDGGDVIFHEARHHGRARGSSAPLEMNVFNAQWFRDGKLYRWEMFLDRDEALRAVGLDG